MEFSVIVPFHNAEGYIGRCAEALLGLDYPRDRYEILMVDNNSSDGSAEIVKRHPGIRLLSERRPGAYAARNRGLREAQGEVIAFTDADCVPRADWLRVVERAMQAQSAGIVLGRRGFPGRSRMVRALEAYEAAKAAYVFSQGRRQCFFAYTNNMAVRRTLIEEAGPFVETDRGGDVVFIQRVIERFSTGVVRFLDSMVVEHLEITSVWQWYRKMFLYGRSYMGYRRLVDAQPLSGAERWRVFRRIAENGTTSSADAALLLVTLLGGLGAYYGGCWAGGIANR